MTRVYPRLCSIVAVVLMCSGAAAEPAGSLAGEVREHRLANGLTVLALKRAGAPTVSLQMTILAGAVDEPSGRTGMAHVLEHMLFKGTRDLGTRDWRREEPLLRAIEEVGTELDAERRKGEARSPERVAELERRLAELEERHRSLVVKDEIDGIYEANGAVGFNAYTSADLTAYTVRLPSNRLELWARIESERMRDPVLREYYSERDVVVEEMRQRWGADPAGRLNQAFLSTAFAAHPYRRPVIGWPSDLEALDIRDTREFYRSFYGPANAVVAAVGDVDPAGFFEMVERYFGSIPSRRPPPRLITAEPPQQGPKRVEAYFDAQPRLIVGYHKPTLPHRHDYVFDVIEGLLTDGRSSRLVRELVDRQHLAVSVGSTNGMPGGRYANLFSIFVTPVAGVEPERIEKALEAELRRLADERPSQEELDAVIRRLQADRVRRLLSNAVLAGQLAYFQAVAGDWRYVEEHPRVLATVTPDEVSQVAGLYLKPENRTVAVLTPRPKEEGK